jgi:pilus assembly protein FimV
MPAAISEAKRSVPPAAGALAATAAAAASLPELPGLRDSKKGDLDSMSDSLSFKAPAPDESQAIHFDLPDLDLNTNSTDAESENAELARQAQHSFGSTEPAALNSPSPAKEFTLSEPGMLEFDLGSLSLDLEDSTEGTSTSRQEISTSRHDIESEDPLATKLALAEEFVAIGDSDGARALIEEVISEATGSVKSRAELALKELA